MRLRTRLHMLELRVGPLGCPACRDRRGRQLLLDVTQLSDGTILPAPDQPPPCAKCGQVPEFLIEVVWPIEEVAGADLGRRTQCTPFLAEQVVNKGGQHQ
jgi:hypothetical protein